MGALINYFKGEPVQTIVTGVFAIFQALVYVLMQFGVPLTAGQVMALNALVVAVLSFVARGQVSPSQIAGSAPPPTNGGTKLPVWFLAVILLGAGIVTACHAPITIYNAQQQRIYNTEDAERAVIGLSRTAINLNTSNPQHLSDQDTRYVRDFALAFDEWRTSYAAGKSTVGQVQDTFNALNRNLSKDATNNTLKAVLDAVSQAIAAIGSK